MVNQTHRDMGKYIDISELRGLKFGKLTILDDAEYFILPDGHRIRQVKCLCECGNECVKYLVAIRRSHTLSCGCLRVETGVRLGSLHGLGDHPLAQVRYNMLSRCYNPNVRSYKNYGARGIIVCDDWKSDLKKFHDWAISNGWKEGLEIDRIDVNGNYCPENCRCVDQKTQARNTTANRYLVFRGEKRCLSEWCEILKLSYSAVLARIYRHPDENTEDLFNYPYKKRQELMKTWNRKQK